MLPHVIVLCCAVFTLVAFISYDQRWIYQEANEASSFNHFFCKSSFQALRGTLGTGSMVVMFLSNSKSKLQFVMIFFYSKYLLLYIFCIGNFILFFLNMKYKSFQLMTHYYRHSVLLTTARPLIYFPFVF